MTEEDLTSDTGQDAGDHVAEPAEEPRTDRESGGPTSDPEVPATDDISPGASHGTRPSPFEPHE